MKNFFTCPKKYTKRIRESLQLQYAGLIWYKVGNMLSLFFKAITFGTFLDRKMPPRFLKNKTLMDVYKL